MIRKISFVAGLAVACVLAACGPKSEQVSVAESFAAVAMPEAHAADAAESILAAGGNAVDASVAAAFVLAVTYPEAGNIGGGGFMLLHVDGATEFLDYREKAPAGAEKDMYLDEGGEPIPGLSLVGHRAAGVPGTVAGLWAAHHRHGKLAWSELLQPAVKLAANGFVMPAHLEQRIHESLADYAGKTNFQMYFGQAETGGLFVQAELAETLKRIARDGTDGFYKGETARLISNDMQANAGLINEDDLAAYNPVWREPLHTRWRDYDVYSAPPPSSGGFAVIQLLKMKDYLASDFSGLAHNSPQYIHLIAEMEKRVFADRAEYFGDPDFIDVPIKRLIDEDYIVERAAAVNPTAISTIDDTRPGLESADTTHFSIVDRWGNAVSNTYTLNTLFGSGVVVAGGGFLLNNEMDDFSIKPDVPNYYGVVGGSANAIEPGKRMLSSMSPTLLLESGEPAFVVGTPGGSTIFTSVFQAIVNVYDFGMTPAEAAAATRFHHQLLPPDLVTFSRSVPLPEDVLEPLRARGYRMEPHPWEFGDLQIIQRTDSGYQAGSDPRGRGVSRVIKYP